MEIGQSLRGRDAPKPFFVCELPTAIRSTLWDLLGEAAQRRPLTRTELKIRCALRPQPWRDLGCDRSTFYRRRKRALLREAVGANAPPERIGRTTVQRAREPGGPFGPPEREGQDGKSYSIRRVAS